MTPHYLIRLNSKSGINHQRNLNITQPYLKTITQSLLVDPFSIFELDDWDISSEEVSQPTSAEPIGTTLSTESTAQ